MEELSYKWRLPFIPVVIDSARLQIGPVIVPGETACWTCWIHRSRQHSPWPDSHASLLQHYATHASEGPAGYLELFAEMAASRVHSIIESLESSASDPGSIWQIDMLTRKILTGRVVGIHDCPRCGNRLAPDTRSYISLQQDLSYLWPSAVTDRG
jgi:bacteriocin biosynthesis cyclodehydratase domain-containing protein